MKDLIKIENTAIGSESVPTVNARWSMATIS